MTEHIHHTQCPSCYSKLIHKVLLPQDHTVSREPFEIWHCDNCSLRFTQNIPDQLAIGRYYQSENYISHTDTNKGLVNRLYRIVRHITLKGKRDFITTTTNIRKGRLLDIGAGTGAFASYMQQSGWEVTGLEPDEQARKNAEDIHGLQLQESSKLFELTEAWFDVITLWHVLEHVHTLHQYIDQLKKILKPGGAIFIAVPNYTSYDAGKYGPLWAAYDVPRHLYHFSPSSMTQLMASHKLQVKRIKPMWFDSFYVSLLSEKYKSGQANLLRGFLTGFTSNLKASSRKDRASSLIYVITK